MMLALTIWILLLYSETLFAMINVWIHSNTYIHGSFILPISAFIIFQKRNELQNCVVRPSAIGYLLVLASLFLWLVSSLASVQVGAELGLIAMIGSSIWAVFGTDVARSIRFALLFAFFAVPFGDFLIPPLMTWTANFAVWALKITGVPVYLEGLYFALPSGDFQVVAACSGIKYLIVTIVLGLFFAYERFNRWWKIIAFISCAAAIMIVANGVRAYLIVLTAHLSDMKYGMGADHRYIGSVVFLLAIVLTFWIGGKYADRIGLASSDTNGTTTPAELRTIRFGSKAIWSAVVFASIAMGPFLLQRADAEFPRNWSRPYLPVAAAGWTGPNETVLAYNPVAPGADYHLAGSYLSTGNRVEFHEVFFVEQSQGDELVGGDNEIIDGRKWRLVQRYGTDTVEISAETRLGVKRVLLTDSGEQLLLWFWYDIGGWSTTSEVLAKVYHAVQALMGRHSGDALFIVVTPISGETVEHASLRLQQFLRIHLGRIRSCMRVDSKLPRACASTGQST